MTTLANLTTYFAGESASMLSAIDKARGGLRGLVKELDPAAAATDRFNKQQALLDNGLKTGRLTVEQHGTLIGRLKDRYEQQTASLTRLNGVSGSARAGMQQLSYQIGDVATQLSLGARPLQVFSAQFAQVVGAVQLMSGTSKGFIGFLAGPWGVAITSATLILAPFVSKMFEGADAAKDLKDRMSQAADGADAFGDAQSLLGKMVDLATGKLKSQNEVLKASILLQALQMKQQAEIEGRKASDAIRKGAQAQVGGFAAMTPGGTGVGQASGVRLANPALSLTADWLKSGAITPTAALGQLRGMQSAGSITQKQFDELSTQFLEYAQATEKGKAAQTVLDYLDGKGLDSRLRQDGRSSGGGSARRTTREAVSGTSQQDERFTNELRQLQDQELGYRAQISSDLGWQAQFQRDRVQKDVESYADELNSRVAQKEITAEQAKALLTQRQINEQQQYTLINWKLDDQLLAEDLALKRAGLDNQQALLQGEAQMARTAAERRAIQMKILDAEIAMQRATLEAVLARHDSTDTEKEIARARLAQLDKERSQQAAIIDRQNMGPMAAYLDGIPRTAAEINESFQLIATDGLAQLNDGLAAAISGSKSFGEVFSSITDQIVADILRIVIQQQLIKPLASLLGGDGGSSGGGLFGLIGGIFGGGGDWASGVGGGDALGLDSLGLPGFAAGGSFMIGGNAGVDKNVLSINGVPRARVSATERVTVSPANDRGGTGGGATNVFDMRGAVVTEQLLAEMNQIANSSAATVVGGYARRQARSARQNLNYGGML